MRDFLRPALTVVLVLLVPIVPFLIWGDAFEAQVKSWLDPPPTPLEIAGLTVAVLATDIFLPVPSSLVSTLAGSQLGALLATLASWLGMTLGAASGFLLARRFGRPAALWFSRADDLARVELLNERWGLMLLVVTRAVPVLAEASVLLVGLTRLSWRPFLIAVSLSNLGIAAAYSLLGSWAQSHDELVWALVGSIALPIVAATIARWKLKASPTTTETEVTRPAQRDT